MPKTIESLQARVAELESQLAGKWISVKDRLPEIPDGDTVSADVLAGFWYKDTWLIESKQDQFSCGVGRVIKSDNLKEFPDGKRWHTYGPAHSQITHWMPLPTPPSEGGK